MELILWLCLLLVLYSYLLYPLLLWVISGWAPRPEAPSTPEVLPRVAVLIAAYNEADCIRARIENLLSLNYPALQIVVGDDGSSDETANILKSITNDQLHYEFFPDNRGKSAVLNDLVASSDAEVLVFTDANTKFHDDALVHLVRHLEDSTIGAVCGELQLEGMGSNQDDAYWRYEQFLKKKEAKIGALLGANGGIYAIRSALYETLPDDTINDDFTVVMKIALGGAGVVYDETAIGYETVPPSVQDEYRRRVRIGAGNYQAFVRLRNALSPRQGALAFTYISHKVLRWFTPHLLLVAGCILLMLALDSTLYAIICASAVLVCLLSFAAVQLQRWPILRLLGFWLSMNIALMHGFLVFLLGIESGGWKSTER